jgi:hypothetical protein
MEIVQKGSYRRLVAIDRRHIFCVDWLQAMSHGLAKRSIGPQS